MNITDIKYFAVEMKNAHYDEEITEVTNQSYGMVYAKAFGNEEELLAWYFLLDEDQRDNYIISIKSDILNGVKPEEIKNSLSKILKKNNDDSGLFKISL